MKVSALDVRQKEFERRFRGLDEAQVRAFLEEVAAELEALNRENIELREELARREERIAELAGRQKLVEDTLLTAQRLSDQLAEQARREAENIVAEAELQGERIVQQANERLAEVIGQINEMKRQRTLFASQLRQAAEAQLALLDSIAIEAPRTGADNIKRLPRAAGEE